MTVDTFNANEFVLAGRHYRIRGQVRQQLINAIAPKIVTGGTDRDSEIFLSSNVMETWRGGLLTERQIGNQPTDRLWESTLESRYERELRLLPLANSATNGEPVTTVNIPLGTPYAVHSLVEYRYPGETSPRLLAGWWSAVDNRSLFYFWNHAGGSWAVGVGSPVADGTAASALTCHLNNKDWALFADGQGLVLFDGANWAYRKYTAAKTYAPVKYLTFWDNKVWGISTVSGTAGSATTDTGTLWMTSDLESIRTDAANTWIKKATLPVDAWLIQNLVTARLVDGRMAIHAITSMGVWQYDGVTDTWIQSELRWPRQPNSGIAAKLYRGNLYIGANATLYEYTGGTVRNIGFDRDYGLPSTYRGYIYRLEDAFSFLLAGLYTVNLTNPLPNALLLAWDGAGWHPLWKHPSTGLGINALLYGTPNDVPRIWWADTAGGVWYQDLDPTAFNPRLVTTTKYQSTGYAIFPWMDMGWAEKQKTGAEVHVRTLQCSAAQTVSVWYATDENASWTSLGTITTNGLTIFPLGTATTNDGVVFRNIRFKVQLDNTSGDPLQTPVLQFLAVRYLVDTEPRYSYTFNVDCSDTSPDGYDPYQQVGYFQSLRGAYLFSACEFRRNGRSLGNLGSRLVTITQFGGAGNTGTDERGQYSVTVVEV